MPKTFRVWSVTPFFSARATIVGASLVLATFAVACKKDSLLQVTDPDIQNPGPFSTPTGATPLRVGSYQRTRTLDQAPDRPRGRAGARPRVTLYPSDSRLPVDCDTDISIEEDTQ